MSPDSSYQGRVSFQENGRGIEDGNATKDYSKTTAPSHDPKTLSAEALSYTENTGHIAWFSIPMIEYVTWSESNRLNRIDKNHYAMGILSFNDHFPRAISPSKDGVRYTRTDVDIPTQQGSTASTIDITKLLQEFPERLLINSLRLKTFLHHKFNEGDSSEPTRPLIILKPFKVLAYLQDEIEARIRDLEGPRKARRQLLDESYLQNYKKYPAEDIAFKKERNKSDMDFDVVLDCYYLDYTGQGYVPVYARFTINSFMGSQNTSALSIMPFDIALQHGLVDKADLVSRSKTFVEFTKVSHRYYSGRSQDRSPWGPKLSELSVDPLKNASQYSERIDSELIVDFERAIQEMPSWSPAGTTLQLPVDEQNRDIIPDSEWDRKLANELMEVENAKWRQWAKEGSGPTDEDDLLLLPDRVFAFVLRTRTWACLQLGKDANGQEQLTELKSQTKPWDNLELPLGHKEIVQSLIKVHFSKDINRSIHFDLVRDKGKGVIILLHGVPGVGKTPTAECVAVSNGRPLLPITCGDLGLTPGDAWDCVLLLDEADIFLAQRSVTDIERNALVSVFLRTLEYYEGVLFLTTNRVGVFDEAFKSRIHISLYYPPLNMDQTIKIWKSHIEKVTQDSQIEVDSMDLVCCANEIFQRQLDPQFGPVWNGRQIRNAFQTAVALASFHAEAGDAIKLDRKHFKQVFGVSDQFSNYTWMVKQRNSDAQWNMMNMVRRDDWTYTGAPAQGTGQAPQSGLYNYPTMQAGQAGQTLGPFPQSTFGQTAFRPSTSFGSTGAQASGNSFGQMYNGAQGGQNQWTANGPNATAQFGPMVNLGQFGQQTSNPLQRQQQQAGQQPIQTHQGGLTDQQQIGFGNMGISQQTTSS
ncbi:hypothetical protein PT974_09840 [Cladobotryum mycophilum]|uniref:AAA+ ATPase domain-containing protein n=1 Tax=Cladobotryum mycophilum TaxID=491253 RepID=A0ABR0SHE4_9HYPO